MLHKNAHRRGHWLLIEFSTSSAHGALSLEGGFNGGMSIEWKTEDDSDQNDRAGEKKREKCSRSVEEMFFFGACNRRPFGPVDGSRQKPVSSVFLSLNVSLG